MAARSARRPVERGVAPSFPLGALLASALEHQQRNIFDGPRQRALTVPPGRLSKCCRGMREKTSSSSLSCMASRSLTTVSRASKTCARAVMDGTRLVPNIIITTRIPITSISTSTDLRGLPHQPGPSDHAPGAHNLTTLVGCSPGAGETTVNFALARDDQQGRSTRPGIDDGPDA